MPGATDPPTFEEHFRAKWKAIGLRPEEIDGKYMEFWLIEGERDRLEKARPHAIPMEAWKAEVDKGVRIFEMKLIKYRKWGR